MDEQRLMDDWRSGGVDNRREHGLRMPLSRCVTLCIAFVASGFAGASTAETTQIDCSTLDDGMRIRCEQVNRMNEICANLKGEERKSCERKNLHVSSLEDCSRAPHAARAMCDQRNRAVEANERCRDLTGPARETCAKQNVTKSGARQL